MSGILVVSNLAGIDRFFRRLATRYQLPYEHIPCPVDGGRSASRYDLIAWESTTCADAAYAQLRALTQHLLWLCDPCDHPNGGKITITVPIKQVVWFDREPFLHPTPEFEGFIDWAMTHRFGLTLPAASETVR